MARRQSPNHRRYPRTARLNELIREILADELTTADDDRVAMITITEVRCEPDMRRAQVFFSSMVADDDQEADIVAALSESRHRLQTAIGRQARMKRTPELTFIADDTARTAARIEDILAVIADERVDEELTEGAERPLGGALPAEDS